MTNEELLDAYYDAGHYLFPCKENKAPNVKGTWKREFPHWRQQDNPAGFWGLPTGNGLFVIDIDTKHNARPEHVESLGISTDTYRVRTMSGGWHFYYKAPENIYLKSSAGILGKGIDTRGEGGYVCCPPSPGYTQETSMSSIHTLTPGEIDILVTVLERASSPKRAKVDGEERIDRNVNLTKLAGFLRGVYGADGEEVYEILKGANEVLYETPLAEKEILTISNSSLRWSQEVDTEGYVEIDDTLFPGLEVKTCEEYDKTDGINKCNYIWRNHIPRADATLVYGHAGSGKTTTVMAMCEEMLENETIERPILWFSCEERGEEAKRLSRTSFPLFYKNVFVPRNNGMTKVTFDSKEGLELLTFLMQEQNPEVVVIDSISSMVEHVDINRTEIKNVMDKIKGLVCAKYGATLIYLHHTKRPPVDRNGNRTELSPKDAYTGNQQILASVVGAYYIKAIYKEGTEEHLYTDVVYVPKNLTEVPLPVVLRPLGMSYVFSAEGENKETCLKVIRRLFHSRSEVPAAEIYENTQEIVHPESVRRYLLSEGYKAKKIKSELAKKGTMWVWYKGEQKNINQKEGNNTKEKEVISVEDFLNE